MWTFLNIFYHIKPVFIFKLRSQLLDFIFFWFQHAAVLKLVQGSPWKSVPVRDLIATKSDGGKLEEPCFIPFPRPNSVNFRVVVEYEIKDKYGVRTKDGEKSMFTLSYGRELKWKSLSRTIWKNWNCIFSQFRASPAAACRPIVCILASSIVWCLFHLRRPA